MCIAILQICNAKEINKESFFAYGNSNPDGFGLMWVDENDKLQSFKTLVLQESYDKYKSVFANYNNKSPILVHFRLGTHGKKDLTNCHPFYVNENLGFIHNGVFNVQKVGSVGDEFSDTYSFNELILKPVGKDAMYNQTTIDLISDFIGWNKILMIDTDRNYIIYNEGEGDWSDDGKTWYSFKLHRAVTPVTNVYTVTKSKSFTWYPDTQYMCTTCKRMFKGSELTTIIKKDLTAHFCEECITTAYEVI